jgi:signal peptidase I
MGIANMSDAVARRRKMLMVMFVGLIAISFAVPMAIVMIMFKTFFIPSGAMENTLLVGDHIIVRQVLYTPLNRGDVVVFRLRAPGDAAESYFLKRCVAVGGDRIAIRDGRLTLNDRPLDEPYVKGKTLPAPGASLDGLVPKGKIAVLGDNRENSMDSRSFGLIDESAVEGKAVLVYWNTSEIARNGFGHMGGVR